MPYVTPIPTIEVDQKPSIVSWNRLEPRPRSEQFNRSLRAEVRDPAWFLARQWQMGEFRAENRVSPAFAQIEIETTKLTHFEPGDPFEDDIQKITTYPVDMPLEVLVEREQVPVDLKRRLQMGRYWTKLIQLHLSQGVSPAVDPSALIQVLRNHYPVLEPQDTAPYSLAYGQSLGNQAQQQILQAAAGRAIDGHLFYEAISATVQVNQGYPLVTALLTEAYPGHASLSVFFTNIVNTIKPFYEAWLAKVFSQPLPPTQPTSALTPNPAWHPSSLEYKFKLASAGSAADNLEEQVLVAEEYASGRLDWYSVDAQNDTVLNDSFPGSALVSTDKFTFIPTTIQFAGTPNARWWEFEDRKLNFGTMPTDAMDFGRMFFVDFMFLYNSDWFSFPYDAEVGSITKVKSLTITDVFGQKHEIRPAGVREETDSNNGEKDWGRWSMFSLSERGEETVSEPRTFLPPAISSSLESAPIEKVSFMRDEMANLVWGVEQTIPDGLGKGMSGREAAVAIQKYWEEGKQGGLIYTDADFKYKLATGVPENWIPFVPAQVNSQRQIQLRLGAMPRVVEGVELAEADEIVNPRSVLLQELDNPAAHPYIYEEEVPREGVTVTRTYQRARWFNGKTYVWLGRQKNVGKGEGSSGLLFDQLLPVDPEQDPGELDPTTVAYNNRVVADGGTVVDIAYVDQMVKMLKSLGTNQSVYNNLKTWVSASAGVKKDHLGRVSKLYSLKEDQQDVIQNNPLLQPQWKPGDREDFAGNWQKILFANGPSSPGDGDYTTWNHVNGKLIHTSRGNALNWNPNAYLLDLGRDYTGQVVIEYSFRFTGLYPILGWDFGLGAGDEFYNGGSSFGSAVCVSLQDNTQLKAYDNTWNWQLISSDMNYDDHKTYHLKMVLDTQAHLADFYLDDQLVRSDIAFTHPVDKIRKIGFFNYGHSGINTLNNPTDWQIERVAVNNRLLLGEFINNDLGAQGTPSVFFDGTGYLEATDNIGITGLDSRQMIVVAKQVRADQQANLLGWGVGGFATANDIILSDNLILWHGHGGSVNSGGATSPPYILNEWFLAHVGYDGADNSFTVGKNEAMNQNFVYTGPAVSTSDSPLMVGAGKWTDKNIFVGGISEVMVFEQVLDQDDLDQIRGNIRMPKTYDTDTLAYYNRVKADGGQVQDMDYLERIVKLLKDQGVYDNVKTWVSASGGVKLDSFNRVSKLYSLKGAAQDVIQNNQLLQPEWMQDNYSDVTSIVNRWYKVLAADGGAYPSSGDYTTWDHVNGKLIHTSRGNAYHWNPNAYMFDLGQDYTGLVTIEFSFRYTGTSQIMDWDFGFGAGDAVYNGGSSPGVAVLTSLHDNTQLKASHNWNWEVVSSQMDYDNHLAYRLKIVLNTQTRITDFYVDGQLVKSGVAFLNPVNNIRKIGFFNYGHSGALTANNPSEWQIESVMVNNRRLISETPYKDLAPQGTPSLFFDGTSYLEATGNIGISGETSRQMIVVGRPTSSNNSNLIGWGQNNVLMMNDFVLYGNKIIWHGNGSGVSSEHSSSPIYLEDEYFLSHISFNTTDKSFRIGKNKEVNQDFVYSANPINTADSPLKIGKGIYPDFNTFIGEISEVMVFDEELTQPVLDLIHDNVKMEAVLDADTLAYHARVKADGGKVQDLEYLDRAIKWSKAQGLWATIATWVSPSFGVKLENGKTVKLYCLKGKDQVQTDVARQAQFQTGWHQGMPALYFDSNSHFNSVQLPASSVYTTVIVSQRPSNALYRMSYSFGTSSLDTYDIWYQSTNYYGLNNFMSNLYGISDAESRTIVPYVLTTEIHSNNVNAFTMNFNGEDTPITTGTADNRNLSNVFNWGRAYDGEYGYNWLGHMADCLIFTRLLTLQEKAAKDSFFRSEYLIN